MKKLLSFLFVFLTVVIASCDKEKKDDDSLSGGDEGGVPEISAITIDPATSIEMDVDWTNGVLISVSIEPSGASMDDITAEVADESVVSIAKEVSGFRLTPKKEGSTKVTVKATRGPASPKTCDVKVNAKGMTNVVAVTKCELLSSDELDKRTLQDYSQLNGTFKVKLTPSNAKLWDDMTWSVDKPDWVESIGPQKGMNYGDGKYGFYVVLKKNSSNATGRTGTMYVNLTPKKGSGSLKVPITVCGHIYKVEFPVLSSSNSKVENGEVYLNGGESLTITPTISKTGNLLSTGGLEFTTPSTNYGISVSSSYSLSVKESPTSWAPSGVILTCKDKSGAISTEAMKVHTYAKPAGIKIKKVSDGKTSYVKGDLVKFNVEVSPSTARQKWTSSSNSAWEVTAMTASQLTIKILGGGKVDQHKVWVNSTSNTSLTDYAYIYIDEYTSGDIKIGDYVVYNSSTKKFRLADGGVRAYASGTWRTSSGNQTLNAKPSLSGSEKIVGIVTNKCSDSDASSLGTSYCKLQGFSNVSGHARMVSMTDAPSYKWSDGTWEKVDFNEKWALGSYGSSPDYVPNKSTAVSTYCATKGWISFNALVSATPRIKAVYSITDSSEGYNKTYPLPEGTTSTAGTTTWLLPVGYFDKTETALLNEALVKAGGTKLSGQYWTACYSSSSSDKSKAYYLDISQGYYYLDSRTTSYKTRPVCYL